MPKLPFRGLTDLHASKEHFDARQSQARADTPGEAQAQSNDYGQRCGHGDSPGIDSAELADGQPHD